MATLKVISINRQVGAFLDWGLAKDLLLPFREQTGPVQVGQDVVVHVYLDERTQRIVASMNLGRDAAIEPPNYRTGQQVEFLITEKTTLGYKALVEGSHPGLLYHEGISVPVAIGQKFKGFVRTLRPDGKIDLSLDQAGPRRRQPARGNSPGIWRQQEGLQTSPGHALPSPAHPLFQARHRALGQHHLVAGQPAAS